MLYALKFFLFKTMRKSALTKIANSKAEIKTTKKWQLNRQIFLYKNKKKKNLIMQRIKENTPLKKKSIYLTREIFLTNNFCNLYI